MKEDGAQAHDWLAFIAGFCLIFQLCVDTYLCIYLKGGSHTCGIVHMWRPKDNLQELVLAF